MSFEHVCPYCKKAFVSDRSNSKYCSRKCFDYARTFIPRNRTCAYCEKHFVSRDRRSKYCSRDCYYASQVGKTHTDEAKKMISDAKMGHTVAEETRRKISNSKNGQRSSPATEFKKGSIPWNKGVKGTHFSPDTEFKKGCDGLRGENCPSWKGGISFLPYCNEFNYKLKETIRDRDERTCQLCGNKENGKTLCVHHVHYDKENCDPDLISLCQACHAKTNWNREYYEVLFIGQLKERGIIQ